MRKYIVIIIFLVIVILAYIIYDGGKSDTAKKINSVDSTKMMPTVTGALEAAEKNAKASEDKMNESYETALDMLGEKPKDGDEKQGE